MRGNLYIPSIDAKDLYLSNNYINKSPYGYKLTRKDNSDNLRKYINSFDYSLDLIELREVAKKVYNKINKENKNNESRQPESLSFVVNEKEYSSKVINVTFKYSVKEYNKISKDFYVKNGYNPESIILNNNGYALNENKTELIAIKLDTEYYNVIDDNLLPNCFGYEYDGIKYKYVLLREPKTIVSSKKLRKWAYKNGFICNGIKYCRFKRSSGSARVGKCLFIDSRLYPLMQKSEQCGLEIKEGQELDKIRKKYALLLYDEDKRKTMPDFLGFIAEIKNYKNEEKKNYKKYNTSMDYLLTCINNKRSKRTKREYLLLSEIFKPNDFNKKKIKYQQIDKVIELAKTTVEHNKALYLQKNLSNEERYAYKEKATNDLLFQLNKIKMNEHTPYCLLKKLESEKDMSVRNYLFFILFNYKNETLSSILNKYKPLYNILEENIDGDINIYGKSYKKADF